MTILHVVPDDALGGGAVNVARLMRAAAGRDEAQLALIPSNADARLRDLYADLPHETGAFRGRGALPEMARAIGGAAGKGDLVHAHGTRAALAASLVGLVRPDLRLVYTVRGFHGLAQPGPFGVRVKLEHWLARRMHATAFVSAADAALARKAGLRHRGPVAVVENGVPLPEVSAPADRPRDIDVLFVGRLVTQKHPEAFVDAAARLPGAPRIVMIGAGELAAEVDARAAAAGLAAFERIDGLGHAEVLARMARARILVMTSRWEGLPTVAIEALLSGCLVAGFDIPPLAEVLEADAPDLLTPHDPGALAERLVALLADEPGRAARAARLGAAAKLRFDPARMAERYAALYAAARA